MGDSPLKGPFPDGDSRNITLVKSDSPIEPDRTGPAEPENREKGAPETVMGDLEDAPKAQPIETNENPAKRARADAARPLTGS